MDIFVRLEAADRLNWSLTIRHLLIEGYRFGLSYAEPADLHFAFQDEEDVSPSC